MMNDGGMLFMYQPLIIWNKFIYKSTRKWSATCKRKWLKKQRQLNQGAHNAIRDTDINNDD